MGYNTTVFILNDRLDELEKDPKQFVEELVQAIHSSKRQEIVGQTTVMPTCHADYPRLYITQHNSILELDSSFSKQSTYKDVLKRLLKMARVLLKRASDSMKENTNEKQN